MFRISVRADVRQLQRTLDDFARRQVPYAAAIALTATAKKVQAGQRELLKAQLKDPTPFTLNAIRVKGARKSDLRATVYMQDITAAYLEPFVFGGQHKLIGAGVTWFNPKHIALNAFGNIPAGTLRRLKARKDVFIGPVKTKAGIINGIWMRGRRGDRGGGAYGRGKRGGKVATGYGTLGKMDKVTGSLTLLIRFGDSIPVRQRIDWFGNAKRIVAREFKREFEPAVARAIATAKR